MAQWNKAEQNTKNFTPCGICEIGLGDFEFYQRDRKGGGEWIPVKGEKKIKWRKGEVVLKYMDFNDKDELIWVEKVIKPKYVCSDCYEKYR